MAISEQNRLSPLISDPELGWVEALSSSGMGNLENSRELGWSESIPTLPGTEGCSDPEKHLRICLKWRVGWSCSIYLGQGRQMRGELCFEGHLSAQRSWGYFNDHTWSEGLRYQCNTLLFTSKGQRNLGNFSRMFSCEAHLLKALLSLTAVTFSLALRTNNSKARECFWRYFIQLPSWALHSFWCIYTASSSACPTSSGSSVSQDYTSWIKPHNKLFWAAKVQEIYFGKSYEKQRRTADVSNRQTFPVWPWVCTLDQSLDNILQHCAKGNNGFLLVSKNSGRADSDSFQLHLYPKTPKIFFILCPWLSVAIIQHLHLSHWRQRSKIFRRGMEQWEGKRQSGVTWGG